MKQFSALLCILPIALLTRASAQTFLPLSDNLDLQSNTDYQISPGVYNIPDASGDGLIRISNKQNITIDGFGVQADGGNVSGKLLQIDQCQNITIRNFQSASRFFYAIQVTNSKNITIENCRFSQNKVDSVGWISIWTDADQALGGGVLLDNVDGAVIQNDTMKFQNDGVALYHCKRVILRDNDFSWNTSFGIRMYFTDSCQIYRNNCAHVNRPFTDPSDCAALLVLVSNNNSVHHNDLSYSGDGVFLGQYEHSLIPNNNFFAYNDCSFSPHNAIEATFADGNIYKNNLCNNSHYGLWLGYSFNSVVDSNDISGNQYAGIAIDRGFNNSISFNNIRNNPTGILLWEGDPIGGYENQTSHDYRIQGNLIQGNSLALSLDASEGTKVLENQLLFNQLGIHTAGNVLADTITENTFEGTSGFHFDHAAPGNLYAAWNNYVANDSLMITRKIHDKSDLGSLGKVVWQPIFPSLGPVFQPNPQHDLAEPPAQWYAYPEACWGYGLHEPTTVTWDSILKKDGAASVHLRTGNGWDLALNHHPGGDSTATWNLTDLDTLKVWFRTIKQIPYGFQFFHIRLGNDHGGWYEYTAPVSVLNNANGSWKSYKFPLSGNATWVRSEHGTVSLNEINYVEIHADTWDFGFDLWVDGLRFGYKTTRVEAPSAAPLALEIFPNPVADVASIRFEMIENEHVVMELLDLPGRTIKREDWGDLSPGIWTKHLNVSGLQPGTYWCRVQAGKIRQTKMLIIR